MSGPYEPGSGFKPPSSYGWRIHPLDASKREFHAGQDFGARAGTPIHAATSGVVVYSGYNEGYGNVVIVKNDTGEYSLYGHMRDGDRVPVA
jgi:murein DD-endopeptidase MepM/ murein hydrolase activator NlpD